MLVKDLYKQYKGYDIILFGRPLETPTIPFTFLPSNRNERDNMIVKDIVIDDKEFSCPVFSFKDLKHTHTEHYKGRIHAYCIKNNE